MRSLWVAGAVLDAAIAAAEPASSPSLCEQLATHVRDSPATVWESGGSLSPWIALTDPEHSGESPLVAAGRAALQKAMSGTLASQVTPNLEVESLRGTGLLMGSTEAGTKECQTSTFALVEADLNARALPAPQGYTGPCWNLHGDLGVVLGQPAYIEHGTVSDTTDDAVVRITPWRSGTWGEACRLTVHLAVHFGLTERFCGTDAALCRAAGEAAADVAHQYDEFLRRSGATRGFSGGSALAPAFHYRDQQDASGGEVVEHALSLIGGRWTDVADFPLFDHFGSGYYNIYEYTFSYAGFAFFPWTLDGRTYLAAAGHAGIGWRGSTRVLVAVYALPEPGTAVLVPLAGFTIDPHPSGVDSLGVTIGNAAVARE